MFLSFIAHSNCQEREQHPLRPSNTFFAVQTQMEKIYETLGLIPRAKAPWLTVS